MAPPRPSAWRINLILFVLFGSFAASSYLVWDRRAPWHPVRTLPGAMQSFCSFYTPVPYVFDGMNGRIHFADTRETYELPREYRGKIYEIVTVARTRASFEFARRGGDEYSTHCWDMAANREVPIPKSVGDRWSVSPSGTRILAKDLQDGAPRRFLVLGLDGTVLHERVLPALDRLKDEAKFSSQARNAYRFSEEGNFLIVTLPPDGEARRVRIYDMASEAAWSFEGGFGDMTDDGLLWLQGNALKSDGATPDSLRALSLKTGKELWRVPIPGAVEEVRYLGRNKLAVQCADRSTSLFDAISGRKLIALELRAEDIGGLRWMEILDAGHESFLVDWRVWSLETGKLLPVDGALAANFFSDGRRVLRAGANAPQRSFYPEIVDLETGRTLFRFESAPPAQYPINACRAGDQVLTTTQTYATQVWERRHPEGWKGHLHRPEVFLTVFLGAAILAVWSSRPRSESTTS